MNESRHLTFYFSTLLIHEGSWHKDNILPFHDTRTQKQSWCWWYDAI